MARIRGKSVDIAAKRILTKINEYDLSSGDVVSDLELSKELNISRTPIREAMIRLIDAGILKRTDTKVVVNSIMLSDIKEILQVREAIELMSINIIASNGYLGKTELYSLNKIHELLCNDIAKGKFEDNFAHDSKFHQQLVSSSKNSRLINICERIEMQQQRLRLITLLTPSRYTSTKLEHEDIILGLTNKDLEATQEAIQKHLSKTLDNYTQILDNKHWMKLMQELKRMNPRKEIR